MLRALELLLAVTLLTLLASCSSATKSSTSTGTDTDAEPVWLEPSPTLEREIKVRAIEVEVIKSYDDFVRLSDWFQGAGEPAYPKLLDMVQSSNPRVRSFALSVISALGDPRLLNPFHKALKIDDLESQDQRYEYARALLSMNDFEGVPILIDGLEEPTREKRALAYKALSRATNNGIKFDVNASPEARAEMVAAWRQWWSEVSGDEMLQRG